MKFRPKYQKYKASQSQIIYVLPNLFTTGNLFFGFLSIMSTFSGSYKRAAFYIIFAALFDIMDGRVARLTKTYSQFGTEYDSLCDLVSFGLAPAILLHKWALFSFGRLGFVVAFLFAVAGALRLARFNVQVSQLKPKFFTGLPIPLAAITVSATYFMHRELELIAEKNYLLLLLSLLLSFLMVSSIKYRTYKDFSLVGEKSFSHLVAAVLLLIIFLLKPDVMLFALTIYYVFSGIVLTSYYKLRSLKTGTNPLFDPPVENKSGNPDKN